MHTSRRLAALGSGVFARSDARKQAYRDRSPTTGSLGLIDLSLGSSDLQPPSGVLCAMRDAIPAPSSSAYCLQAATAPFREAVADWCQRRFGVTVDPEHEVQLLVGSQEGTAHLPLAVLNPGDPALLLDPCYPSHRGGLLLADADVIPLRLQAAHGWRPPLKELSASVWDRLKLFVFGYPHNPTACVGDQELLDQIMHLGERHKVVIAHDNPYVDLALEGQAPSLLHSPGWREWGVEFFSLSKGWCLGGFRLAFAVGASPLIAALRQVKAVVDFNQSLALQQAAITALRDFADWPATLRETYRQRRDRVLAGFAMRSWSVPKPDMALYLWVPCPEAAAAHGWKDERCAAELLQRSGVALTPGSGFGQGGEGWLRMALVRPSSELEAAVSRLADAVDALA
ncbi:aminotransferase class I/II-fold pyridoxal phosphate-dependent enzyme [Synechococcus sp. MIT S1220]|uniref:aminotransferase class I/II-fold pyridoxal phosphate-dependent enzyme n=1 Tax=Synechococcus sp. MIT S1220 TaxID=3082549 RepID=UPI0039B04902